jgi:hypothetical protein
MRSIATLFLVFCCLGFGWGQLSITSTGTNFTIDFDNTGSGVNNGTFDGSGFAPSPAAGQLDSDGWSVTGLSDGDVLFGGAGNSGDFARGSSSGGVSTGGVYAFEVSTGNNALGVQPGGSDFAPGEFILKVENNTGSTVSSIDISYLVWAYNDQDRANNFNLSYSEDDLSYTAVPSLDFTSTETTDATPSWVSSSRGTTITGLTLADGDDFYFKWTSDDVSGSGSRDELALDDISISFSPSGPIVGWDNPTSTENETNSTQTVQIPVTLSNYSQNVDLDVAVTGGTAESGDYTLNTNSLSFTGNGTQNVSIDINDDADSDDETIEITLTESTSTGVAIAPDVHTITISDDEVPATPQIKINEIDAQNPGSDTEEFVELYDNGIGSSSLDGLILVLFNGNSNDESYDCIDLDGEMTNANGYFVIGNIVGADYSTGIPANDWLQNGVDAVGLYRTATCFSNGTPATTTDLEDAIVYSENASTDTGLENALGVITIINEGTSVSAQRSPEFSGPFNTNLAPTPGMQNALPITLQSLTATPKSNTTHLHWRTATELNNDYMAVEHSTDGRRYSEIGRVLGAGTTQEPQDYSFVHEAPAQGINYYRLRQVDYDGQYEYHGPVTARFGNAASVLDIFPTATADELTVSYEGQLDTDATLSIQSTTGRSLREWAWDSKSGRRTSFSVADLPAGWYVLRLRNGREVAAGRFLKQ